MLCLRGLAIIKYGGPDQPRPPPFRNEPPMIKTKSVHSPIAPDDGLRILAARLRGRGLPANRYDVWMANLGPSEALLRDLLARRVTWAEFGRRYRKELME